MGEVTWGLQKNQNKNKLVVEENCRECVKVCLPSDHSISQSVNTQETDELSDKENLSVENLENTSAKLSESQSSPTVSVRAKPNFATIEEAVEAMRRKREEKKNLNKVAPDDVQSRRDSGLDLSALKIGSVRGRRLGCITRV